MLKSLDLFSCDDDIRLTAMMDYTILLRISSFFSLDVNVTAGGHVGLHHTIRYFCLRCFSLQRLINKGGVSLILSTFTYNVARTTQSLRREGSGILKVIINISLFLLLLFTLYTHFFY